MRRHDPVEECTDVNHRNGMRIETTERRHLQDQSKDNHVEISRKGERSFPQHQPITKPVVLFPVGRSDRESSCSSTSTMSYAPGELQMVEQEIKDLLSGYKRLVGDVSDTQQIAKNDKEWIATRTPTTTTTNTNTNTGPIKLASAMNTTSTNTTAATNTNRKTTTTTTTAAATNTNKKTNTIAADTTSNTTTTTTTANTTTMITATTTTATATTTTTNNNNTDAIPSSPPPRLANVADGVSTPIVTAVSAATVLCDRGIRSSTSLPVSSVHGDHSTDANTPTPSVQMPKQMMPVRENNGTSEDVRVGEDLQTEQAFEHASSPVDLFADALTEDHLNRSFEMQLQRRQQELELVRRQQQQQHLQRHGIPVIQMAAAANYLNGRLPCNVVPSSAAAAAAVCVEEEEEENGMHHPAVWRATGTPVPPFVRQNKMSPNGSRNSVEGNYNNNNNNMRGSYISAAATATTAAVPSASTHRYQKVSYLQGDRLPIYTATNYDGNCNGIMNGQEELYRLRREDPNEQVYVRRQKMTNFNNGHTTFQSNKPSQKTIMKNKQYPLRQEEEEEEVDADEELLRLVQQQQEEQEEEWQRQYYLRNRSRHRGKCVDSMTPEIATSARRTENPSMRSGATGGKKKKTITITTGAAATGITTGKGIRHMLNGVGYPVNDREWEELAANGVYGFTAEGENILTEERALERGEGSYREQQQQQQQQIQKQQQIQQIQRRGKKYHGPQADIEVYEYDRHPKPHYRHYSPTEHQTAVTRFHNIIERRVAALEGNPNIINSNTNKNNNNNNNIAATAAVSSTIPVNIALPSFADSLVGAAISDLCPVVKRRQAQLKESQLAEAAAAAAADANRTRTRTRTLLYNYNNNNNNNNNNNKGSVGTVNSTPSTTPTPSTNVRSSRGSWIPAAGRTRPRQQQQQQEQRQ